jgi:high mobility group AT-hook protein 2
LLFCGRRIREAKERAPAPPEAAGAGAEAAGPARKDGWLNGPFLASFDNDDCIVASSGMLPRITAVTARIPVGLTSKVPPLLILFCREDLGFSKEMSSMDRLRLRIFETQIWGIRIPNCLIVLSLPPRPINVGVDDRSLPPPHHALSTGWGMPPRKQLAMIRARHGVPEGHLEESIEEKWGSLTLQQKAALMEVVDVFLVEREEGTDDDEMHRSSSSSSSPAKRIGRPPKVLASKGQSPGGGSLSSSSALEGSRTSSEPKKRRGRPPKAAAEAKQAPAASSGKKRGRPPKNPRPEADDAGMEEEEEEEDLADGGASSSSAPPAKKKLFNPVPMVMASPLLGSPPKKRGRPPKAGIPEKKGGRPPGRPPKVKEAPASVGEVPVKRGPGRPPKSAAMPPVSDLVAPIKRGPGRPPKDSGDAVKASGDGGGSSLSGGGAALTSSGDSDTETDASYVDVEARAKVLS